MHPTLEELFERDSAALEHLASCAECRARLTRSEELTGALRALPLETPERDLWPSLRRRLSARRTRRIWIGAAAAAAIVLFVSTGLLLHRTPDLPARDAGTPAREGQLQALIQKSQQLETLSQGLARPSPALSGWKAYTISTLEDRIAAVDAQISAEDRKGGPKTELVGLWKQRVQLLGALVETQAPQTEEPVI
ncbi:MAG: hypothetical protein P8Z49_07750 [Acidobacteriota bacterium]|jgi:hypothetical protein